MRIRISDSFVDLSADDYSEQVQLKVLLGEVQKLGMEYAVLVQGDIPDELIIHFTEPSKKPCDWVEKPD